MTSTLKRTPTATPPPRGQDTWFGRSWRAARRVWRRLTSMRTALVLLFLLAVASVPGSLLPQKPLNPTKVTTYLTTHKTIGPWLNRLGFFDVFGSPWFAAIYLLLAISLIGCLTPRIRLHWKAMRSTPLPAPKNLLRLPESGTFDVSAAPEATVAQLRAALGRRWRTKIRDEGNGSLAISAEKGYSRETGNLLFHIALLMALVTIATGRLWGYTGSIIVTEGHGFCNTVQQYDSWRPGRFAQDGKVGRFCVNLNSFTADYLSTGEPSQFSADVDYSQGTSDVEKHDVITVNHPLRLDGDRVYLIGHGFSPKITVRMPDGTVINQVAAFIPQDPNTFYSQGAFSLQGKVNAQGKYTQDIGISGFFAPTPENVGGVITSSAPQAKNPVLGIFVYQGDLGRTGLPQSVYSLNADQIASGALKKVGSANLTVGQSLSLPSGAKVTFDGWAQWTSIQISHDPTQQYVLVAAVLMVLGLIGSLAVRRRRLWIRVSPAAAPPEAGVTSAAPTVVQVGGLARSDSGNFTDEFAALMDRLQTAVTASPATTDQSTAARSRSGRQNPGEQPTGKG